MDIFDRIASEFKKEARIPKGDKGAYEEWKENLEKKNPSAAEDWAKYEGAFDPSTGKMNESRIKENEGGGKGKKASFYDDEIIDDLGFDRFASLRFRPSPRFKSKIQSLTGVRDVSQIEVRDWQNESLGNSITSEGDFSLFVEEGSYLNNFDDPTGNPRDYVILRTSFPDDLGFDRYASEEDEIIDDLGFDRYASEEDGFFFTKRR